MNYRLEAPNVVNDTIILKHNGIKLGSCVNVSFIDMKATSRKEFNLFRIHYCVYSNNAIVIYVKENMTVLFNVNLDTLKYMEKVIITKDEPIVTMRDDMIVSIVDTHYGPPRIMFNRYSKSTMFNNSNREVIHNMESTHG